MMRRSWLLLPMIGLMLSACGNDGDVEPPAIPPLQPRDLEGGPWDEEIRPVGRVNNGGLGDAADQAVRLTGGTALETSTDRIRGLDTYRVKLEDQTGAIYDMDFAAATGQVVRARGLAGPFLGMTFEPSGGFVALLEALSAARESHPGNIQGWELGLSVGGDWVYEVPIDDGDLGRVVTVDARAGEVVSAL